MVWFILRPLAANLGYGKPMTGFHGADLAVLACRARLALTASDRVSQRWRRTWLANGAQFAPAE